MKNISFNGNWFEHYYEKRINTVIETSIYDITRNYNKYRNVQAVMKYISTESLKAGFYSYAKVINNNNEILIKEKAKGLNNMSKEEFEKNIDININTLYQKLKNKEYKPQPMKRTYIKQTKVKDRTIYYKERPISITNIEDAVLQITITNQILNPLAQEILTSETFAWRLQRACKPCPIYG